MYNKELDVITNSLINKRSNLHIRCLCDVIFISYISEQDYGDLECYVRFHTSEVPDWISYIK